MALVIDNQQTMEEYTPQMEGILEECMHKALEAAKIDFPAEVSVVLVDNEEIHRLNNEYRGIDRATDVLSFPMLEYPEDGRTIPKEELLVHTDPDTQEVVLGDIVISLERTREQAVEYEHSFERELGFLMVHGMLHLLGYDHETEQQRMEMRQLEEAVLERLKLTRD